MSTCSVHYYNAVRSIVLRCGSYRYFIQLVPYVLACSTNIQRKIPAVQPSVSVGRSGSESTQKCLLSAFTYFGRAAPPPRIYINVSLSAGLKKHEKTNLKKKKNHLSSKTKMSRRNQQNMLCRCWLQYVRPNWLSGSLTGAIQIVSFELFLALMGTIVIYKDTQHNNQSSRT